VTPTAALMQKVRRQALQPPPKLRVSEFADRELVVTTGPRSGMRWRTSLMPFQAGILDALTEPGIEYCAVMGSAQWGKTSCAVCLVAYHVVHDPTHALIVEPTVDPLAREFSKNRLGPVIEASPALRERMAPATRTKTGSSSTLFKTYRGGSIAIGGANSAASLAVRSVRLLILDEIERFPAELEGEGATIEIALKRTLAYRGRRRIILLSSPKLTGGPIHRWFHRGDQRRFYVPCPTCRHMHVLTWANVRWQDRDPETARFVCPACQSPFGDAERNDALADGEWRAEQPEREDRRIVSFHLWEGYSPLSSLAEIVRNFLAARQAQKEGDRSVMHTWQNTTLGEPVEPDAGEGVEPHTLLLRRESYGAELDAPDGVCAITMGVDVQDDRLELLVVGWGPGEESWLLDRAEIPGDTSRPESWANLDQVLGAEYRHPAGSLAISATCIDSAGHRTSETYDYVHRNGARRVFATIGRDGQRPIVSSPSPRGWGRGARQVRLFTIGVDTAKALFMSRLALTEKGPGYVHIPSVDWADDELVEQLTSERLFPRWHKGVPEMIWKKTRARNEALDCVILAHAALRLLNPKLEQWAADLRGHAKAAASEAAAPARDWLPRRKGWFAR